MYILPGYRFEQLLLDLVLIAFSVIQYLKFILCMLCLLRRFVVVEQYNYDNETAARTRNSFGYIIASFIYLFIYLFISQTT